jgi:D-aspartate ligase
MTPSGGNTNLGSPPVLTLGGGIVALSVARSLGVRGIKVYAFDVEQNHARYSRLCSRIPFKGDKPEAWLEWLTSEKSRPYRGSVIIPCADEEVELLARHRAKLEADYVIPEANDDVLLAMLDKAETYPLAQKAGIPVPETWFLDSREQVEAVKSDLPYPCALKPRYSHEFRGHVFLKKLFLINDQTELLHEFNRIHDLGIQYNFRSDLVITEIIPGNEDQFQSYFTFIDENGSPLFRYTKRKLRQYPNNFGNGTYHMSEWIPEVADLGQQLFEGIGYRGMGNAEFKRDPRDGLLKLIECNPRITNATELIRHSGFDMPLFIYNRMTGNPLPPMQEYKDGVRSIRPVRDFLAARKCCQRGEITWKEYVRSLMHRFNFEIFAWHDPLPFLMMGLYYLRRLKKMIGVPVREKQVQQPAKQEST